MKSKLNVALAAAGCALALSVGDGKAATLMLNVSGTMVNNGGPGTCTPICTLGGFIVIDNTAGTITSPGGATMSGASPSVGPFTTVLGTTAGGGGTLNLNFEDSNSPLDIFQLNIASSTLIGYTGGPLGSSTNVHSSNQALQWIITTGSLSPAISTVPLPGALPAAET